MSTKTGSGHEIADLIRVSREADYRTAKDFFEEHKRTLQCSYPHYAAIEASKKFPDIELAIRIAEALGLDLRRICLLWAKDQMPTAQSKKYFQVGEAPGAEALAGGTSLNLENVYIFSDRQLPALLKNPEIWEVLILTAIQTEQQGGVTAAELVSQLGFAKTAVETALKWLKSETVVKESKGRYSTVKEYFHLPDTPEFRELRNRNFRNISGRLIESMTPELAKAKRAFRTTIMVSLPNAAVTELHDRLNNLITWVVNQKGTSEGMYALTVAMGERAKLSKSSKAGGA